MCIRDSLWWQLPEFRAFHRKTGYARHPSQKESVSHSGQTAFQSKMVVVSHFFLFQDKVEGRGRLSENSVKKQFF